MSKEAMKLALEAFSVIAIADNLDWIRHQAEQQAAALREALANEALDKKAENARELGLDYEPLAGTQVSKVWWDGERLMAKPIPLDDFYEPAQQEPVAWMVECGGDSALVRHTKNFPGVFSGNEFNKRPLVFGHTSPPAQRKPLADEEIEREWQFLHDEEGNPPDHHDFARAIEAAHGIK